MNELVNLNQIVSEIKFFENQAVVSYWEIGKRLSKAKKQVGHGNWENWIDENLGYTSRTARRLIKVFDEYPNPTALSDLNMTQALAIASIKDEEERQVAGKKIDLTQNSSEGTGETDEIVANKLGIGSKDTYRKGKSKSCGYFVGKKLRDEFYKKIQVKI